MTPDGGMNPNWDEARLALGRVAELFIQEATDGDEVTLERLRLVDNYELIPESVRETIEDLGEDDRRLVTGILTKLADNHFYLENNLGLNAGY
jgi:hypothetical protein